MTNFLNALPLNGYKTYLGLLAAALLLGFQQLGYVDPAVVAKLMPWVEIWTGIGMAHKIEKASL